MKHRMFNWLVKGYHRDRPSTASRGYSPLDIPILTIVISLGVAYIVSALFGNMFLSFLYSRALNGWHLGPISVNGCKEVRHENLIKPGEEEIVNFVQKKFLAKDRIQGNPQANSQFKHDLWISFQDTLGFESICKFIKTYPGLTKEVTEEVLAEKIVGNIPSPFSPILLYGFHPDKEKDILDSLGIKEYYSDSDSTKILNARRDIILSGISQIREELSQDWLWPRRLLQALAASIQWITWIFFIWGMILVWIRWKWAAVQKYLADNGKLPLEQDNQPGLWDPSNYGPGDVPAYGKLEQNYPGLFVAPRLIKEVRLAMLENSNGSIRALVQERISAFRSSVDVGEYELINFIVWVIPSLGFLGTIIGIIGAMENVAAIVRTRGVNETGMAIKQVSVYLGVAFDTTFVALVLVVILNLFLSSLRKREANFFELLEYQAGRFLTYTKLEAALKDQQKP